MEDGARMTDGKLPFTGSEANIFRVNELCFCDEPKEETTIITLGEADGERLIRTNCNSS